MRNIGNLFNAMRDGLIRRYRRRDRNSVKNRINSRQRMCTDSLCLWSHRRSRRQKWCRAYSGTTETELREKREWIGIDDETGAEVSNDGMQ